MGTSHSTAHNSAQDFQEFLSKLSLVRKEHSINLLATIDLYKQALTKHPEDLLLILEQPFDEQEGGTLMLQKFKQKLQIRKK